MPQGPAKLPVPAPVPGVLLSADALERGRSQAFPPFQRWAATSDTGDRAELEWLPDNFRTWNDVCSSSEYCLGQQCGEFSRCHLTRLRNEAAHANIVLVNHHLFFADLALRGKGLGEVIPEYQAVVFDEAHQLEDVVGEYFGAHFSSFALSQLAQDILKECRRDLKKLNLKPIQTVGQQLEVLGRLFHHNLLQAGNGAGRNRFEPEKTGADFTGTCRQIAHALEELPAMVEPFAEKAEGLFCTGRRASELSAALKLFIEQKDESLVYWQEITQQAAFLNATPIDVAPVLKGFLFSATSDRGDDIRHPVRCGRL